MINYFDNANGERYIIVAENKELDRVLLCHWNKENKPRYIVAWGLNYNYHSWAQGHYFMEDFKAACDYLNGKDKEEIENRKYVTIKDFLLSINPTTKIMVWDATHERWLLGGETFCDTPDYKIIKNLPDNLYVENASIYFLTDEGDCLSIDVSEDPRI